jgi:arabinogalactan endo-1,4-beta-galactosidase
MARRSRIVLRALAVSFACVVALTSAERIHAIEYAIGADMSFLADAEARGKEFKDNGVVKPGLQIFKDHGYNWIRLRLFHTPSNHITNLPNDLEYTIALAKQAKDMGYKFLLDYHYSDTWADPGKQFIPSAWVGQTQAQLVESVFEYTRDTIIAFREAGAMPDMVQNGNEIIAGMLWPNGRIPQNWDNFADLVKAGINGVEAGTGDAPEPLIMVQIDKGGNWNATRNFYDNILARGVEFDVIGQSYYPWWHGSIADLTENMHNTALRYDKDIMVVEAAYNWRPAEYRFSPGPFPETPEGQREFLETVDQVIRNTPNNRGKGIFWWEPAVYSGHIYSRGVFDNAGNALPVVYIFDPEPVPEPSTWALASLGVILVGVVRRKRRRSRDDDAPARAG